MLNLLRAERLQMRKSLGFWVLAAVAAAMALLVFSLSAAVSEVAMNGATAFYQSLGQAQMNLILVSILASILICGEFSDRTFGLSLFSGYSRRKLMAAKIIMLCIGTVIITTVMPAIMTVSLSFVHGFGDTVSKLVMLRDYGLYLLGNVTLAAVCAFLAYLIKNVGGTIGAGIGGGMFLAVLAQLSAIRPSFQRIAQFSFITQLQNVSNPQLNVPLYAGVMVVTLAAALLLTALVFEKSELK